MRIVVFQVANLLVLLYLGDVALKLRFFLFAQKIIEEIKGEGRAYLLMKLGHVGDLQLVLTLNLL